MVSRSYWESLWQSVPEGQQDPDLGLRRAFLLDRVRAAGARSGSSVQARGAAPGRTTSPPPRVLDVGCGEGQLTAELVSSGMTVVGVDVAAEPLRRARASHPGLDLRIVPADGRWPLQDASFDVAWAGDTIEHVIDTASWLSEVRRVLRPGGTLLLSTPDHGRLAMLGLALSRRAFDAHFDPRADHLRFYSSRTLARLLADFGFHDIEVRGAGGLPGARRLLLAAARRSRF
jgi:2-polyprenyl-3-methyl-5-hydroxy-6-metoxy-1,4-benzoquinol methylase